MSWWKRQGELVLVPAEYNPEEVLHAVDGSTVVGMVTSSDVYRGQFRAGVYGRDTVWMRGLPLSGTHWICVSEDGGERLVDKPQAGTEEFRSPQEALAAIARNRLL
ncbi:hypothetical protein [Kitasatospora cheerisanensis]|uniref:Uncharacterized protein n=1 Tax=Kitasatospora cheerisanensis KCTC 2395 TaxID=1348663 RepID=A0A066Z2V2_9ACTN|nr:hypothetical protein [Kitasatospora cheerisanensis]KDN88103.1 hypothetical protein KCH_01800 [Kitasatospora cheerisanensis KCTC 2395]